MITTTQSSSFPIQNGNASRPTLATHPSENGTLESSVSSMTWSYTGTTSLRSILSTSAGDVGAGHHQGGGETQQQHDKGSPATRTTEITNSHPSPTKQVAFAPRLSFTIPEDEAKPILSDNHRQFDATPSNRFHQSAAAAEQPSFFKRMPPVEQRQQSKQRPEKHPSPSHQFSESHHQFGASTNISYSFASELRRPGIQPSEQPTPPEEQQYEDFCQAQDKEEEEHPSPSLDINSPMEQDMIESPGEDEIWQERMHPRDRNNLAPIGSRAETFSSLQDQPQRQQNTSTDLVPRAASSHRRSSRERMASWKEKTEQRKSTLSQQRRAWEEQRLLEREGEENKQQKNGKRAVAEIHIYPDSDSTGGDKKPKHKDARPQSRRTHSSKRKVSSGIPRSASAPALSPKHQRSGRLNGSVTDVPPSMRCSSGGVDGVIDPSSRSRRPIGRGAHPSRELSAAATITGREAQDLPQDELYESFPAGHRSTRGVSLSDEDVESGGEDVSPDQRRMERMQRKQSRRKQLRRLREEEKERRDRAFGESSQSFNVVPPTSVLNRETEKENGEEPKFFEDLPSSSCREPEGEETTMVDTDMENNGQYEAPPRRKTAARQKVDIEERGEPQAQPQQPQTERRRRNHRAESERKPRDQHKEQHKHFHSERPLKDSGNQSPPRDFPRSKSYLALLNPFKSSSSLNPRKTSPEETTPADPVEERDDNDDDPGADTEGWNDRSAVERTKRRRARRRRTRQRHDGGGSVEGGFRRWLPRSRRRRAAHHSDGNNRMSPEERGKRASKRPVDDINGSRKPRRKPSRPPMDQQQRRKLRHPERQRRPQSEGRRAATSSALNAQPRRTSHLRKHNNSVLANEVGRRDPPSWSPSRSDRRLIRSIVAQNTFDGSEQSQQALAAVAAAVIAAGGRSKMKAKGASGPFTPHQTLSLGDSWARHSSRSHRSNNYSGGDAFFYGQEILTKASRSQSAPDEREVFAAEFLRQHCGNEIVSPAIYALEQGQSRTLTRGEAVTRRRQILFGHKYRSEQWKMDAPPKSSDDVRIVHLSQRKYSREILRKLSEDFEVASGQYDETRQMPDAHAHTDDQPINDKIEKAEVTDSNDGESQQSESSSVLLEVDTQLCRVSEDARILMEMMEKICHDMGEESPFRPVSEVIPEMSDMHRSLGTQLRKLNAAGIRHHESVSPPHDCDDCPATEGTDYDDESLESETEREDYRATYGIIAKASEERATKASSPSQGSGKRRPLETGSLHRSDVPLEPNSSFAGETYSEGSYRPIPPTGDVASLGTTESDVASGLNVEPTPTGYNRPPHQPPTLESLGLSPLPTSSEDGKEMQKEASEKPASSETNSTIIPPMPWWKQFQNHILPKTTKQGLDSTPSSSDGKSDKELTSRSNRAPHGVNSAAVKATDDADGNSRPTLSSHTYAKSERGALSSSLRGKRSAERPRLKRRVTFADVSSIKKPDYSSDGLNGSLDLGDVFTWAKDGTGSSGRPPLPKSSGAGKSGLGPSLNTNLDNATRGWDLRKSGTSGRRKERHFNSEESLTSAEGRTSTSLSLNSGTSDMSVSMADLFDDDDSNPILSSDSKSEEWRNGGGLQLMSKIVGTATHNAFGGTEELDSGLNESKAISMEGNCSDDDSEESLPTSLLFNAAPPPVVPIQKMLIADAVLTPSQSGRSEPAVPCKKNEDAAVYVDFEQGCESNDKYSGDSDTSLSIGDLFDTAQPATISVEKKMFAAAAAVSPVKSAPSTTGTKGSGNTQQETGSKRALSPVEATANKDHSDSETSLSVSDLFDALAPGVLPLQKTIPAASLGPTNVNPSTGKEKAPGQSRHENDVVEEVDPVRSARNASDSETSLSVSQLFEPAPAAVPVQKAMLAAALASPMQKKTVPHVVNEAKKGAQSDTNPKEETPEVTKGRRTNGDDSDSVTSLSVSQLFDPAPAVLPVKKTMLAAAIANPIQKKSSPQVANEVKNGAQSDRGHGEETAVTKGTNGDDADSETSLSVSELFDATAPVVAAHKKVTAAALAVPMKPQMLQGTVKTSGHAEKKEVDSVRKEVSAQHGRDSGSETSLSVSQIFDAPSAGVPLKKQLMAAACAVKPPSPQAVSTKTVNSSKDGDKASTKRTPEEKADGGSETSLSVSQLFDTATPAALPIQKKMLATVCATPVKPAVLSGTSKSDRNDKLTDQRIEDKPACDSETSLSVSQLFDTATPAVVPIHKRMFAGGGLTPPIKPPVSREAEGDKHHGGESRPNTSRVDGNGDESEASLSVSQLFDTASPAVVTVQKAMSATALATPSHPPVAHASLAVNRGDVKSRDEHPVGHQTSGTVVVDSSTSAPPPVSHVTQLEPQNKEGESDSVDSELTEDEIDAANKDGSDSETSLSISQLFDTATPAAVPVQKKMLAAALVTGVRQQIPAAKQMRTAAEGGPEGRDGKADDSETSLSVSQLFDAATPAVVPLQKKIFSAALATPLKLSEARGNPVAKHNVNGGKTNEGLTTEADSTKSDAEISETSLSVSQLFDAPATPVIPAQKKMLAAALAVPAKPPALNGKNGTTDESEMITQTRSKSTEEENRGDDDACNSETSLSVSQLFDTASPAVMPVQKKMFAAALRTPVKPPTERTEPPATENARCNETPTESSCDDRSDTSLSVSQLFDTAAPSVVPVHKKVFAMALPSAAIEPSQKPSTSLIKTPAAATEDGEDGTGSSGSDASAADAAVQSGSVPRGVALSSQELRLGWYKEVEFFLEFAPSFAFENDQIRVASAEFTKDTVESLEQSAMAEDDELAPMTFRRSSRASIAVDTRRHSLRRVSVTDLTIVTNDSTVVAGNKVKPPRTASTLPVQQEDERCNDDNSISRIEMSSTVPRSRTDSQISTISDVTEDCESLTSSGDANNGPGFVLKARKEASTKHLKPPENLEDVRSENGNPQRQRNPKANGVDNCFRSPELGEGDQNEPQDLIWSRGENAIHSGVVSGSALEGASILHGPKTKAKEGPVDPPMSKGVRRHRQLGRKGPALGPESEAKSISFVANYMYLQCDVADPSTILRPSSLCHGTGIHGGADDRVPIQENRSRRKGRKKKVSGKGYQDQAVFGNSTEFGSDLEDVPEDLDMSWDGETSRGYDEQLRSEDSFSDDDYSTEQQLDGDDCRPRDATKKGIKNLPYFPSMSNYGSAAPSMLLQNLRQHLLPEDHGEVEFDVEDSEDAYDEVDEEYYDVGDDDGPYDDDYYEGEDYYDDVYYDDDHYNETDEYASDNVGDDRPYETADSNDDNENGLLVSFGGRPSPWKRAVRTSDLDDLTDEDRGTEDDTDDGSQVERAVQWMRDLRTRLASAEAYEGASQDGSALSRDSRFRKLLGLGGLSEEIDENLVSFYSARKAQKREARRKKAVAAAAVASSGVEPPERGRGRRLFGLLGVGGGGSEAQSHRPPLPPDVIHTPQYHDGQGGRPTHGLHMNQRRPSSSDLSAITWSSGGTKHSLRDEMLSMHWLRGALFHGRQDP